MFIYKIKKNTLIILLLISIRPIVYSIGDLFTQNNWQELFFLIVEILFVLSFILFFLLSEFKNTKKYIISYLFSSFFSNFITLYYFEIKFPLADIGLVLLSSDLAIELLILILLLYPIYLLNRLYLKQKYKSDNQ